MPDPERARCPDIARLERAVLDAVPPDHLEAIDGWLVGIDPGMVSRARSAVPLAHAEPADDAFARIEAIYAAYDQPAMFRLPVGVPAFSAAIGRLEVRGYRPSMAVLTMTTDIATLVARAGTDPPGVGLDDQAGDDWVAVFMGDGFDPVDGASRTRLLRRARSAVYGSVRSPAPAGETIAVGFGCLSRGLLGVHGMRTRPGWRNRGHARRLIAAMAGRALDAGLETAFLQVEEGNAAAIALYRRLGFETAWRYAYWRCPDRPATP